MVGCQSGKIAGRFDASGVEESVLGHDSPRGRFRLGALRRLVIVVAVALTLVNDRDRRSPGPREGIGPMPGG
jgi:hypothetical protein